MDTKTEGEGVTVCPGPNMAYFSKKISLKKMIDHIYGRTNVITRTDRPNMFTKELKIYIDYLSDMIDNTKSNITKKQEKSLQNFSANLKEGINYYSNLFNDVKDKFNDTKTSIFNDLKDSSLALNILNTKIQNLSIDK